jgi:hypothetical protein
MMEKPKFTPGPWRVKSDVDPQCPWIEVSSELDETLICDACTVADAYLIAAAPDMFTALEDAFANGMISYRLMGVIRAALAKARGQA